MSVLLDNYLLDIRIILLTKILLIYSDIHTFVLNSLPQLNFKQTGYKCIAKWCLISHYVTTPLSNAVKQDDRSLV